LALLRSESVCSWLPVAVAASTSCSVMPSVCVCVSVCVVCTYI